MAEFENNKKQEQPVTELDPGDEPIDAPVEPAVDHAMVVKQFLANPDSRIMLNKNMPDEKKFDVPKYYTFTYLHWFLKRNLISRFPHHSTLICFS